MPVYFREMYTLTRVIIDCTEIFIEKQIPLEVKVRHTPLTKATTLPRV
jgi:hypothetical protein